MQSPRSASRLVHYACAALWSCIAQQIAVAADLAELPVLASSNGALDLLMVARPAPISSLEPAASPTGWVYDVCARPTSGELSCPITTDNLYAGARLAQFCS